MKALASIKIRLDKLLLDLGYFDSREKARTCIMMNGVSIGGRLYNKAGEQINEEKFYAELELNPEYIQVDDKLLPYVSRGAFKLQAAHQAWGLDFNNKVILDIGASTGGFTDYALQNGAQRSIALDVGKGQLHYKLQQDPRVVNLEGVNFKEVQCSMLKVQGDSNISMIVIDVSFISLITILEKLKSLIKDTLSIERSAFSNDPQTIALIKPQFEAGKEIMDKCQGIIKDDVMRKQVLEKVLRQIEELGYINKGLIESPIKGAKGNVEYLVYLQLV